MVATEDGDAPVPSAYYVSALVTDANCGSSTDRGWTLEAPAAGATECAVTTAPPTGYYASAAVTDSQCGGFKGWTLSTLTAGVTECPMVTNKDGRKRVA